MDSGNLRTFIEVVRCGSFSKAAEALFVTQSAVSRRIKLVEERFGCQLIDRNGPLLKPTEAGLVVYQSALRMVELESELDQQVQRLKERPALSIAYPRPFGIVYMPAIMKKFLDRFEGKVDLNASFATPPNALQGLRDGRLDLVVVEHWEHGDFTPFQTVEIGTDEMVFVSAPELGLTSPDIGVDELIGHRLYRRREDCCSGKLLAHNMALIGRDPGEFGNIFIYDDMHVIVRSVLAGEGIVFISRSLVTDYLEAGTLREHRVPGFVHKRRRTLVYRERESDDEAFQFLFSCILETFGIV